MTPRQAALLSVNSCIKNDRYVNLELSSVLRKYKFEGIDRAFFTALFYGTVEKTLTLDYVIRTLSSIPFDRLDHMVLCLVRIGLYQILFMDRVPDHAAVDESVELAKRYCPKSSVGFVNAVLRSAVREKNALFEKMKKEKGLYGVSVLSSIPEDILRVYADSYGEDTAKKIAAHFACASPSVTLRTNTLKTTREKLLAALGPIASPTALSPCGIRLSGSFPVEELFGFSDGLFFVQDEASQLAAGLLKKEDVPAGGIVVDVCACPGGKSFSAAISLEDKAVFYDFDLHENKLSLIRSGAERLGITSITTAARDGRDPDPALFEKASAVICDVPCSGLGVLAKKPDIRYKPVSDSQRLPDIQREILKNSAKYVKAGGVLIYSTCTLNKRENEDIVETFLKENPAFSLSDEEIANGKRGMATLFPYEYDTDGFFMAKLKKGGKA